MLSILIQLNPSYLLGVMEKDPLVLRRYDRGSEQGMGASSRSECGTGQKISTSPGGRRERWDTRAAWVAFLLGLG